MSYAKKFRVDPGKRIDLDKFAADFKPKGMDRDEAEERFRELTDELRYLQHLMYAEDRHSLLVVLQGRDASGKDGTIRHVFGPLNPQGTRVTSFKVPSKNELAHDFLWRCHQAAPKRGTVAVFNRSHYEDVLVVRVHDLVPKEVWSKRYDRINAFERLLTDAGTVILEFYLHIDREEQLSRFKKRIDNPKKTWKISAADYGERPYWDALHLGILGDRTHIPCRDNTSEKGGNHALDLRVSALPSHAQPRRDGGAHRELRSPPHPHRLPPRAR